MIDVHAHLEQKDYDKDRDSVIQACQKDLDAVITSAPDPFHYDATLQLAQQYPGFVYASLGLHPTDALKFSGKNIEQTLEAIKNQKKNIVAVGEVGLDYYWNKAPEEHQKQQDIFLQCIELANSIKKPLVIHSRDANPDVFRLLDNATVPVVLHCFGDKNSLDLVLEKEWYLSIAAIIATSKNHRKIVKRAPLERLLTETDAPWLHPEKQRNTPQSVKIVIEKIAKERKMSEREVDKVTTATAKKVFSL